MIVVFALAACTSIDCPLNNRVYATFRLAGDVATLVDTLTVSTPLSEADGSDSVLVNRLIGTDSLSLPMSYARPYDTYYFSLADTLGNVVTDTVVVTKEDLVHFESVDCNPTFFHTITSVDYTTNAISLIEINNNQVTYDASRVHFLIYFKSDND